MSDLPPPPGWYPDPVMPGTQRYWDGTAWSDHVAPVSTPPPVKDDSFLVIGGFIMAVAIPLVGFVIGCVLLGKKPGVGIGILALSLVMAFVWFDYFSGP